MEVRLHELIVQGNLFHPFPGREEEGDGVGIGFGQDFHAARVHKLLEAFEHFRSVLHHLFDKDAGQGEADPEVALVLIDQFQQEAVHGQIALVRNLQHDGLVGFIILVHVVVSNVEE